MPIPYDLECNESMSYVWSNKSAIVDAITKIKGLANGDTWKGPPADNWTTDLDGHVNDALAALGEPLETAVSQCHKNAQKMKADSARAAAAASSGAGG